MTRRPCDCEHRLLYRPAQPMQPLPLEPPSASVIRELELQLNGRVLSPAPKEGT